MGMEGIEMGRRFGIEKVLKDAAIIVTAILAVVMVCFFWAEDAEKKQMQEAYGAMQKEIRPLELELYGLQQELADIKEEEAKETLGVGSMVLLFTDLSEIIYTDVYPQMEKYGFKGVLALGNGRTPGAEGCMNEEQFNELLKAGWECCLRWDTGMDEKKWPVYSRRLARIAKITRPESVYFLRDSYDSAVDEMLEKQGFSIAAHHGEKDVPLIATEAQEGLWHPGAMAWNGSDASVMLEETMAQRGNLIFTVGQDSPEEEYQKDVCETMLGRIHEYCEAGELQVMTLSEAAEYREALKEKQDKLETENGGRKTELENQIDELERRIKEITEKYRISR